MKILYRLAVIAAFVAIFTLVISYARGYRIDFKKKSVTPTGILAINSFPKAAKIYLNGELKGITDTNLTLLPGQYRIEIKKDGYTSWTKTVKLKGELVLSLEALLFPINPSLSPLTNLGIVKAIPIDQTEKIILLTENGDSLKDGIYLFENKKPLSFMAPLKLIVLKSNIPNADAIDLKSTNVYFSPDYKQAVFDFFTDSGNTSKETVAYASYLLSLDEENKNLFDITLSKETLLEAWNKEKEKNNLKVLETFPKEIAKIATDSFHIISFSPDETKILYRANKPINLPFVIKPPLIATNQTQESRLLTTNNLYIYDKKEDKNFVVENVIKTDITNNGEIDSNILWYPDSKHLIINEGKKISIIDYDNENKQTIYSGPFEANFFTSTTDGKIIVLTNLNPETNKLPDLYLVGIK